MPCVHKKIRVKSHRLSILTMPRTVGQLFVMFCHTQKLLTTESDESFNDNISSLNGEQKLVAYSNISSMNGEQKIVAYSDVWLLLFSGMIEVSQ
jgi:hypothetical protein